MKVTGYICCTLVLGCLLRAATTENSQNKVQQRFLDSFPLDETSKTKRPFCNAFTGCGRKRSFYESSVGPRYSKANDNVQLPLFVYKSLVRAATQNIRDQMDRDANDYQLPEIPQVYLSRKMPLRKRLDVPSIDLD